MHLNTAATLLLLTTVVSAQSDPFLGVKRLRTTAHDEHSHDTNRKHDKRRAQHDKNQV